MLAWQACIIHGRICGGTLNRGGSSFGRRAVRPLGAPGPAVGAGVGSRANRRVPSSSLWRRPFSARERISDRGGRLCDRRCRRKSSEMDGGLPRRRHRTAASQAASARCSTDRSACEYRSTDSRNSSSTGDGTSGRTSQARR